MPAPPRHLLWDMMEVDRILDFDMILAMEVEVWQSRVQYVHFPPLFQGCDVARRPQLARRNNFFRDFWSVSDDGTHCSYGHYVFRYTYAIVVHTFTSKAIRTIKVNVLTYIFSHYTSVRWSWHLSKKRSSKLPIRKSVHEKVYTIISFVFNFRPSVLQECRGIRLQRYLILSRHWWWTRCAIITIIYVHLVYVHTWILKRLFSVQYCTSPLTMANWHFHVLRLTFGYTWVNIS